MNLEIERKFLVDKKKWASLEKPCPTEYRQGYISSGNANTVRIRIAGEEAFITIKGKSERFSRMEFEYPICKNDAALMIQHLCFGDVTKFRYKIMYKGKLWEVDEFSGNNEGLIMAEIELSTEDEAFEKPEWLLEEVTEDRRYYNIYLAQHPFTSW